MNMRELPVSTTALADVLAILGRRGWLSPPLFEFAPTAELVTGVATTIAMAPGPDPSGGAFEKLYARLDDDLSSRIVVIGGAGEIDAAVWGQILSRAARRAGAIAAVIDGCIRDRVHLAGEGLPVWARRECTVGGVGVVHVTSIDEPVMIGGVTVRPGDRVTVDRGGAVVLDSASADALLTHAREYATAEDALLKDLRRGVPLGEAYEHKRRVVQRIRESL